MQATEVSLVAGVEDLPAPSDAARQFIDAWKAARQGRLIPRKQDFDPLTVFPLLPNLWIYHYDRKEDLFRCRLAGENINKAWGRSIAGKLSQDIFGARDNAAVVAIWKKILDVPLIHFAKLERLSGNRLYVAERTVTPLADATGRGCYVLGLSLYALAGAQNLEPPKIPANAYHILCEDL